MTTGLDFHLYSHAVIHWNLPLDPVALEQREGRVHRFKGHAVRKNVAERWGHVMCDATADPWDAMFEAAIDGGEADGIKPYWVFEGRASVQRIVPMLPMSREHTALERLKRGAANYRTAFGQPRHSDPFEILDEEVPRPAINFAPG